jgi:MOSC domain-containing protein
MHVTALFRYPVKSLGGTRETALDVEPWGPAGDRRWAVVDEQGAKLTARTVSLLLRVRAEAVPGEGVRLTAPSGRSLLVREPDRGPLVPVSFRNLDHATDAGDAAGRFLSAVLGRPVRLVWQASPDARAVPERNGGLPGERVSLADAGPVLLTSERSLAQVHEWAEGDTVLSMLRFRPNVVIDGDVPFAEEAWSSVTIGAVTFRCQQACDRCVMTMIDPETLAQGKEPLRTLARHRKRDGKTWFGVRLVPLGRGAIAVGDPVAPAGA